MTVREHYNHVVVKDICQFCNKRSKPKIIEFYYWRIKACKTCENIARRNGHIK